MSRFVVKKVAVLGAGVMGAQIAAHLVNVRVPVVLFDLPAKEGPKSAIAQKAIANLKKLKPSPLGVSAEADLIAAANYEEHLELLKDCDLVIEAIAERMDWKRDLYHKIAPFVAPHAILASNTSGLSITALSEALPEQLRHRFCGIHFFNPPRYMQLVELIPTAATEPQVLDQLETFATTQLGKGVVRAKDTPNFVANRVGVAGMLSTIAEADRFGLTYDVVDDLTGKKLGRASSGTFRTADVVGLDTLAHVIGTMQTQLSAQTDSFYASYATPAVITKLIADGALGQKTKAGFYRKTKLGIERFDPEHQAYVPSGEKCNDVYARMLKKPAGERLQLLRSSEGAQGQFLWAILRNSFHYAAVHLKDIADNARDVDLAMRWGFGMQQGPFELWQEAGWLQVAKMVQEDIDAGKALSTEPLPQWVFEGPVADAGGVHTPQGSWSAAENRFVPRRDLPVYARQLFPERVLGEAGDAAQDWRTAGRTLTESKASRTWTLDDQVLVFSIKTKMHAISPDVMEDLQAALALAEKDFDALVVWSGDAPFSVGADLQAMMPAFALQGPMAIDQIEQVMQQLFLAVRYAQIPVVGAVHGMALGGGCELLLHCARRVAHMESYIGLVEMGVGLVPGAGGLTNVAYQAARHAQYSTGNDLLPFLANGFTAAAKATVGTSALESQTLGYLQADDVIVPHRDELLFVALTQAKAMAQSGWRPPQRKPFPVAGRSGAATLRSTLVNMREGGFITEHDMLIASHMANVVCGGDVDAGTLVNEEYLMALERKAFTDLIVKEKTQERILGMLSTGKPVRN